LANSARDTNSVQLPFMLFMSFMVKVLQSAFTTESTKSTEIPENSR
jgi:hypothetical protein